MAGTASYILPTVLPNGVGWFVSADVGHWFLGTTDSFHAVPGFPGGIPYKSYSTWDVGLAFTWKQFTLDLRYSDTDLNKGDCNAFTSDFTAGGMFSTPINPRGPASNWCGATFLARLSVDLARDNLNKPEGQKAETERRQEENRPQEKKPPEKRPEEKKSAQGKRSEEKRPQERRPQEKKLEDEKPEDKKPEDKKPEDKKPDKKEEPNEKTPWDIAFGGALASEFNIRGISASDHRPSPVPYFEPRYDFSDSLQAYLRLWGNAFASPNRAAVAINLFAGARPTFGPLALDYGFWQRWFPGGQCVPAPANPGICLVKADLDYWEIFAKATYTIDKQLSVGGGAYWSPSVLNSGDPAIMWSELQNIFCPRCVPGTLAGSYPATSVIGTAKEPPTRATQTGMSDLPSLGSSSRSIFATLTPMSPIVTSLGYRTLRLIQVLRLITAARPSSASSRST